MRTVTVETKEGGAMIKEEIAKMEELVEKYFDGCTTCEEERRLRRFFMEEEVPDGLAVYRPLFACLAHEAEKARAEKASVPASGQGTTGRKRLFYLLAGMAATVLLLVGTARLLPSFASPAENYVIIDGQRYTDRKLAEAKALEALQNIAFTDEELNNLLFPY